MDRNTAARQAESACIRRRRVKFIAKEGSDAHKCVLCPPRTASKFTHAGHTTQRSGRSRKDTDAAKGLGALALDREKSLVYRETCPSQSLHRNSDRNRGTDDNAQMFDEMKRKERITCHIIRKTANSKRGPCGRARRPSRASADSG
jgi:hypothetical protein